jgi:hypothetical protein
VKQYLREHPDLALGVENMVREAANLSALVDRLGGADDEDEIAASEVEDAEDVLELELMEAVA